MAKSKSGEFYSFDEVLRQLSIDENRLKRLVSEGEIRAFREGGQMRFKKTEIDGLAGRTGRGSQTSETSLTEISLEDDDSATISVGAGDTLSDDLLAEPDLTASGGMRTAEISSQDTFIDQGQIGMSTEPIDFTEDGDLGADEEVEDIGVDRRPRRGGAGQQRRTVVVEEARTHPMLIVVMLLAALAGIYAALTTTSIGQGGSNSVTEWGAKTFLEKPHQHPAQGNKGPQPAGS